HHHAPALGRHLPRLEAPVRHGLFGSLQREVDVLVTMSFGPGVFVRRPDLALDLARDLRADALHGDLLDLPDGHPSSAHAFPEGVEVRALGGDGAHACYYNPDRLSIRCGHESPSYPSRTHGAQRQGHV